MSSAANSRRRRFSCVAGAAILAAVSRPVLATVSYWSGAGDGVNWTSNANWTTGGTAGVPPSNTAPGNDVEFGGGSSTTVNLDASRVVNSVTFETPNWILGTIGTANVLTVSSTIVNMDESVGTINAVVSGENGLYVNGYGQLTLTASNTYNSGTALNGVTSDGPANFQLTGLTISSDASLGVSGNPVSMTYANVFAADTITTSRDFSLSTGGFGAASGTAFTIDGTVSVGGSISAQGQGTIFFNNTDGPFPTWPTLIIGTVAVGGSSQNTGPTNVQFSSAAALGGGAESIQIGDNSGLELTTGSAALSGAITTADLSTGSVANFTADSAAVLTVSGAISDGAGFNAGGVSINGPGTVVFSAANHYGGSTTINGNLSISANTDLPANNPLIFGWTETFRFFNIFTPGTLITTQSMSMSRPITLGVHGGGFAPAAGTQLTLTGSLTANGGLTMDGPGQLVIDGSNVFTALPSLTIVGGDLIFAPATETSLITSNLVFNGTTNAWTGQLDLLNGDMIVHGGSLATITNQIAEGYNGGRWNGSGIISSIAANDGRHNTGLGVILNDNGSGTPLYGTGGTIASTFGGDTPLDGDILVQYSYYGDTNLDGKVDGSDYSRIDFGALHGLTGWYNGDFNYDGIINGSDYTLIDNSFNTQGAETFAEVGDPTAVITAEIGETSAVPEPASAGFFALATLGMRRRRQRERALQAGRRTGLTASAASSPAAQAAGPARR